jgi:hypothetical protein
MDVKQIVKWGLILIVGYLVLRWGMNFFSSLASGAGTDSTAGFLQAPYAGPVPLPYSGVVGWAAPWNYPYVYGGIPPRVRKRR